MPSLGTLVTVVTADTSGFQTGMDKAAAGVKDFEAKTKGGAGLSGWGKEIETIGHKFTTLGGIMKIVFGIGTAKAILSAVHHELVAFGEGFGEATKAGEGFFDALADGLKHMVGMETHFEALNRHAKENIEIAKELAAGWIQVEQAQGIGAGRAPTSGESNISRVQSIRDSLVQKQIELFRGNEKKVGASEGRDAINKARLDLVNAQIGADFGEKDSRVIAARKRLADAQEKYSKVIQESEETQRQLDEVNAELARITRQSASGEAAKNIWTGGPIGGPLGFGLKNQLEGMGHLFIDPLEDMAKKLGGGSAALGEGSRVFVAGDPRFPGTVRRGGIVGDNGAIWDHIPRGTTDASGLTKNFGNVLEESLSGLFHAVIDGVTKGAQTQVDHIDELRDAMEKQPAAEKFKKAMEEHDRMQKDIPKAQGKFGGLEDLHNAIQMAALESKDPPTKGEQIKQTGHLDSLDKQLQKFGGAQPLIWS